MEFKVTDEGIEVTEPVPGTDNMVKRIVIPKNVFMDAFYKYIVESGMLESMMKRENQL